MAELLYATAHLAGDFPNPANAVGNTPGTWAGTVNSNTNYTSRWAIGDPVDPLTGGATQTIRVVARKGSNSGTPTIALNLYENGVLVQPILAATNITSNTGQTLVGTFNTSAVTNRANVEIEVVQTSAGGNPSTRNCAQISHIEWTADTTAAADPVPEITSSLDVAVDLGAVLDQPTASVPELTAPLDVEVSLDGTLDQPTATVPEIGSDLNIVVDLGGEVIQPSPIVPELTAALDVTVALGATLDQPTASIPEVATSLNLMVDMGGVVTDPGVVVVPTITTSLDTEIDLGGVLDSPTPSVGELTTSLPVVIDMGAVLDAPGGVPTVAGSLGIEVDMGGVLTQPVATVPEVSSSLDVLVTLGATVGHPAIPAVIPIDVTLTDLAPLWAIGRLELQ